MKKLSTLMFCLMAVVGIQAAVKTAWEGSQAISWSNDIPGTQYEVAATAFEGLQQGDVITAYTTLTGDYGDPQYTMTYKAGDGWEWTDLTIAVSDEGVMTYTVESEQIATEIAERGLIFRGQAYTVTKITFGTEEQTTDPDPQPTETTVWTGSEPVSWSNDIPGTQYEVAAEVFANVTKGSVIRFYTQATEGGDYGDPQYNITYKAGDDWTWTELTTTASEGVISYTVESDQIAAEISQRGIIMRGQAYTLVQITVEAAQNVTPDPTPDDPAEEAESNTVVLALLADATGTVSETDDATGNTVQASISEGNVTITPIDGTGYTFNNMIVEQLVSPANADQAMLSLIRANAPAVGYYITATDNQDGTYSFQMPESAGLRILATFDFTFLAPTLSYNGQTHVFTLTDANEADKDRAAKMYYSTDGKENWTEYTEGVTIDKNTTVWTKAVTATKFEAVSDAAETFYVANVPLISYENGVNTVTITLQEATDDYTAGAAIYYTLDGSDPTFESSQATSGEPVSFPITTTVVKAMAVDANGNWSAVAEQQVEYARYLTVQKQWVTFYSPETFAVPEGLKAYTVSEIQYTEGEEGTIVLTEQSVIAAETPMLIENTTDAETRFRVYNSDAAITGTPCTEFKGTSIDMTLTPDDNTFYYVLVDGIFQRSTAGTLPARNCYLELGSGSAASHARRFSMVTDDMMLGIGQVESSLRAIGNDAWYGLNGMRMAQPQKGIYVNKGRKIVVR